MGRRHRRRLGQAFMAMTGLFTACAAPGTATGPHRATPTSSPTYAYPDSPPLVDRDALDSLLIRLDSQRTVLWVFRETTEAQALTAALLAEQRDRLRAGRVEIVALWAGPSRAWREAVVPMLHGVGANYPCAVISPPTAAAVAAWLASDGHKLEPGFYVVDRYRQVVSRLRADAAGDLAALLAEPADANPVATRPVPADGQTLLARVRLVEITTGRVLARVTAQAAAPAELAGNLARQLTAGQRPDGPIAICPLRPIGPLPADPRAEAVGRLLAEELRRQAWPDPIPPEIAGQTLARLGLTPSQVEFDPAQVAGRTAWKTLLVGSIEALQGPIP